MVLVILYTIVLFADKPICVSVKPFLLVARVEVVSPAYSVCEDSVIRLEIHSNSTESLDFARVSVALAYRNTTASEF